MDTLYLIFDHLKLEDVFNVLRAVGIEARTKYLHMRFSQPTLFEYSDSSPSFEYHGYDEPRGPSDVKLLGSGFMHFTEKRARLKDHLENLATACKEAVRPAVNGYKPEHE